MNTIKQQLKSLVLELKDEIKENNKDIKAYKKAKNAYMLAEEIYHLESINAGVDYCVNKIKDIIETQY